MVDKVRSSWGWNDPFMIIVTVINFSPTAILFPYSSKSAFWSIHLFDISRIVSTKEGGVLYSLVISLQAPAQMGLILSSWEYVVICLRAGMGDIHLGEKMEPIISGNQDIFLYLIQMLFAWDFNSDSIYGSNCHCFWAWPWLCQFLNCTCILLVVERTLVITAFHSFLSDFLVLSVVNMYVIYILLSGRLISHSISFRLFPIEISVQVTSWGWILQQLSWISWSPWYHGDMNHYTIYLSPSLRSDRSICSSVSRLFPWFHKNFRRCLIIVLITMILY